MNYLHFTHSNKIEELHCEDEYETEVSELILEFNDNGLDPSLKRITLLIDLLINHHKQMLPELKDNLSIEIDSLKEQKVMIHNTWIKKMLTIN